MKTSNSGNDGKNRGLTLIEVIVVVIAVAVLAFVFLGSFTPPRHYAGAPMASCENNLKQIGLAYRTWEGDYGDKYPMSVPSNKGGSREAGNGSGMYRSFQVMSNELNNPRILICPSDDRQPAADFGSMNNSNLSYFVGLDADETLPAMVLSGDRNLVTNGVEAVAGLVTVTTGSDTVGWSDKMHHGVGIIGLADGSVQRTGNTSLQTFFNYSGKSVNRLAVP